MKIFAFALLLAFLVCKISKTDATCMCNDTFDGHSSNVECLMNKQIRLEYKASYFYDALAAYFERTSVGKLGFTKFFREASKEEIDHARSMTSFVNSLGMKVKFSSVTLTSEDTKSSWNGAKEAVEAAIKKENLVYGNILCVHRSSNDEAVQEFLDHFIKEQVKSINDLTILKSRLSMAEDTKLVEFLVDKEFL